LVEGEVIGLRGRLISGECRLERRERGIMVDEDDPRLFESDVGWFVKKEMIPPRATALKLK
jgi:hypothetical protein